MATCRDPNCRAEITFVKMRESGRPMPCEVEPDALGNIVVEADGLGVKLSRQDAIHYTGEKWMPHWRACPGAAEFRQRFYVQKSEHHDEEKATG